jgi:UDP-glucose 4-epimerase
VLDDLSTGALQNLKSAKKRLRIVKGDVRDSALLRRLVKKSHAVFHLAEFIPNTKQTGSGHVVKFSVNNPFVDLDICVRGTLNILEAARQSNARVLFTSTAAVYGETPREPIKETAPANPRSPYGASKFSAELYCKLYSNIHDLDVKIVRLFNVFGPRQRKYIMYDVLSRLQENPRVLTILGSGEEVRDFVYVKDAVAAILLISSKEEYSGQIFNIGTGIPTSMNQLAHTMTRLLNLNPQLQYTGSTWQGDIKYLVADISKLKKAGFSPEYSLEKGLTRLFDWFKKQ